jgi:type VI secretion system secreted protein Hcp
MSDLHFGEWQPESPFTELEGHGEDEYELEYEDETRLATLSRAPLGIAQRTPAPAPASESGTPKTGSTARVTAGLVFVKIQGTVSGAFPGNMTQKGREGWIAASGFAHEVKSPRDASSGLATGKRQHQPVTLTLPWTSSSVLLFHALVNNEVLKTVVIEFAGAQATGVETVAQRVTLTNASVSDIRRVNDRSQANQGGPVDIVALTYQKIKIEDPLGGQAAEDDWAATVSELEFEEEDIGPETEEWLGETYQLEDTGVGEFMPDGSYN